ncbi:OLC1v1009220C1 [Oldenlandia corymbosa var. corymbosa]|uniref:OLC1v1009220C1 n=1 Tax=Oldenlandia corymbosa var. corymbosa TaxID=529605 RepID=A0AAV1DNN6_OLDCO|nr:OLC1v1009220C1 [Oldenlandia corymbosa var. corymbosa]
MELGIKEQETSEGHDTNAKHCTVITGAENNDAKDDVQDDTKVENSPKQLAARGRIDGEIQMEDDPNKNDQQKQLVVFDSVITNKLQISQEDVEDTNESVHKEEESDKLWLRRQALRNK